MEIWKDISGYEGHYQISIEGKVKSLVRWGFTKEVILKLFDNLKGYPKVNLYLNGKLKTFTVHRLVASAFIPNPSDYPQVNHKDTNKWNNNVENLEWCNNSYNLKHHFKLSPRTRKRSQ